MLVRVDTKLHNKGESPLKISREKSNISRAHIKDSRWHLLLETGAQSFALAVCCRSHHQTHDETVKTQCFCKDEDQYDTDEESRLLRIGTDTCITDDTDSEASRQGA